VALGHSILNCTNNYWQSPHVVKFGTIVQIVFARRREFLLSCCTEITKVHLSSLRMGTVVFPLRRIFEMLVSLSTVILELHTVKISALPFSKVAAIRKLA